MIAAALLSLAAASVTVDPLPVPAAPVTPDRCAAGSSALIGSWTMDGSDVPPSDIFPGGDSREFDFVVEDGRQLFREYLHFRPGSDGEWVLQGCRLTISGRNWYTTYIVLRLNATRLALREEVGGAVKESFTRIAE